MLETLSIDDLGAVTRLHRAAFPTSALTQMGDEAVVRYYHWLFTGPFEMYAHGVRVDDVLAGFCFGGIAVDAIGEFLRRNAGLLASRVIRRPWVIADPLFRDRLAPRLSAVFRKRRAPSSPIPASTLKRPYDILSIGVDPVHQGAGLGKLLMARAEATARQNGFHVMTLMVGTGNEQAIRFYESLGWEKAWRSGQWRGNMERWLIPKEVIHSN